MGSFNATCQISQMPIECGDPVRFLLLVKCPFRMDNAKGDAYSYMKEGQKEEEFGYQPNADAGREGCYAEDFWMPEFVPVRAKYNDYGSVEKIDTECLNWKFWMDSIESRTIEIKQGSNTYHDPAVSKNMDLNTLLDVLGEGRLMFDYGYKGYKVPVCQTMIREDVYQAMLKLDLSVQSYSDREREYTPESIYKDAMKHFSEEKIKSMKDTFKMFSTPKEAKGIKNSYEKMGISISDEEASMRMALSVFYNHNNDTHFNFDKSLKRYSDWMIKNLIKNKFKLHSEKYNSLMKDLSDWMFVTTAYSYLRKTWHPGTGLGSQSAFYEISKDFYSKMGEIAGKNAEEQKERYED